jgi:hypothetical protein
MGVGPVPRSLLVVDVARLAVKAALELGAAGVLFDEVDAGVVLARWRRRSDGDDGGLASGDVSRHFVPFSRSGVDDGGEGARLAPRR